MRLAFIMLLLSPAVFAGSGEGSLDQASTWGRDEKVFHQNPTKVATFVCDLLKECTADASDKDETSALSVPASTTAK